MPIRYLGPKPENVPSLQEVNIFMKGFYVQGDINTTGEIHAIASGAKNLSVNPHSLDNDQSIVSGTTNATKTGFQVSSTGSWTGTGNVNRGLYVTVSGGQVNYPAIFSGGNVGINISAPQYLLDVNGTARLSGQSYVINRLNVNNAQDQIDFDINTAGTWGGGYTGLSINNTKQNGRNWYIRATADGATEGAGKLLVSDATSSLIRLSVDSAGKFGIGTDSPSQRLHVQDIATTDYLQYKATSGGVSNLYQSGQTGTDNYWRVSGTDHFNMSVTNARVNLTYITSGYFTLGTNNTERMRIASNGRVGIKTTTANSTFQVNGSFALNVKEISSTQTLGEDDTHIFTVGNITVNLPDATTCAGRMYWIKSKSGTSNIVPFTNQQIDNLGANAGQSVVYPDSYTIISDGTAWWIM